MSILTQAAPAVDYDRAADFLSTLVDRGTVALARIVPDGGLVGAFPRMSTQRDVCRAWLAENNATANLHFSLNEPKPKGARMGKAGRLKKVDVAVIRGVVLDLDPREEEEATEGGYDRERARLLALANEWAGNFLAPPTTIIDSGNGVQMIWLLKEPLPNTPETCATVECQSKALGRLVGSDKTHSIDHLFRIPFTTNWPDAKKRAKGRRPSVATLLRHDPAARYSLETLAMLAAPLPEADRPDTGACGIDYDAVIGVCGRPEELPPNVAARVATLRDTWSRLEALLARDVDRSARDYAIAARLAEDGLRDPTELAQAVFAIAPSKLEEKDGQGYGASYAAGTVARALAKTKARPVADEWFASGAAPAPAPASPAADVLPPLCVVTGLVDAQALPVRCWLVAPRLPIGDVTQCVGEPGISKSTFALRDALAVATGDERLLRGVDVAGAPISPERLHQAGAVIVYNAEDRAEEMRRRLAAAQRYYGVTPEAMAHPIILWSGIDHPRLTIMQRRTDRDALQRAPGADTLEQVARQYGAVLIILDPQVSLCAGARENDNDDQDDVMQTLAVMATKLGCNIQVVHHTAKATRDAKGDMGAGRGGFAAVGKVRSAFTLCNVTGQGDEKDWGVNAGDRLIRLDYSKVSHDRRPTEPLVFRRVSAPVGNGAGAAGSAAAVFDGPPREALRLGGDRAPVLELIDHRALVAAAAVGGDAKDKAQAVAVAEIADDLLGTVDRIALGDMWPGMGERMRTAGLCKAKARNSVTAHITAALGGNGASFVRRGQVVRIRVAKDADLETSPWWVVRTAEAPVAGAA
ncbi:AAA family ATPase [Reyranella sp.]|uniref:AAA family ATPase n=1 Tax=Reyranella sp. TaxID=1929291 RepID=UPI003C7A1011